MTTENVLSEKMTLAHEQDQVLDIGLLRKLYQDKKYDFYLHMEIEKICKKLFLETSNQNLSLHQRQILQKIKK